MNAFLSRHILPLIIMLADLAIAFDLDRWREVLRQQNALTPNLSTLVLWSYTISSLLIAVVLLAQFTWVIFRPQRSRWIAGIYILTGLFFSGYPVLYFSPVYWLVMPLGAVSSFPSYLLTAGAFIAITGLAMLFIPGHKLLREDSPAR